MSSDLEASPQKNRLRRDWSSGLDVTSSESDESGSESDDEQDESEVEQDGSDNEGGSKSDSDQGGDASDNDEESNAPPTLNPTKGEKGFPQTIKGQDGAGLLHIPRSFFTEEQRQVLRSHQSAFREGDRKAKTQLVNKLATQLKKEGSTYSHKTIRRKIYKYMGSGQRSLEKLLPWKKPSLKSVVAHEHEEEIKRIILEKYQLVPGDRAFIGKHASVVKEFMDALTETQMEELQLKLAEWRARIHMETGARMVVLAGFRGRDSQLRYGIYDFNAVIGAGKPDFSKFFPGCSKTEMTQRFQEYLQDNLTDSEDDASERPVVQFQCSRKPRPPPTLSVNDWGEPLLPNDFSEIKDLEQRKDIIRAWIAGFYNLAAGTKKTSVPWSSVKSNPENYIEPGCWPSEIEFKEPSKLRKEEIEDLYNVWVEREKNKAVPAFQFHHVKGSTTQDSTKVAINWRAVGPQTDDREGRKEGKTTRRDKNKESAKGRSKRPVTGKVKSPDRDDAERQNNRSKKTKGKSTGHAKHATEDSNELCDFEPKDDTQAIGQPALDAPTGMAAGATNVPVPLPLPTYTSQPLNMPNLGAPVDRSVAMSALGLLTQLLTGQGNLPGIVGSSGFQPPVFPGPFPAIDPSLGGSSAPALIGYPTGGPNDSILSGYYPVPHDLMPPERPSPSDPIATKEFKEAPITKPKPKKDKSKPSKEKSSKQSTSARQKDDRIKTEMDSPTKRSLPLRVSPNKRKFKDFDGHSELVDWEAGGKTPENGTKRRKVAPRPLTKAQKAAKQEAITANPDTLFVRSTHRKQR